MRCARARSSSDRGCGATTRTARRRRSSPAGVMIRRNPGVALIWITGGYKIFRADGGTLFRIGSPEHVRFFAEGRPATRDEVMASIDTGLPALREIAERQGPEAVIALDHEIRAAMTLVDAAVAA